MRRKLTGRGIKLFGAVALATLAVLAAATPASAAPTDTTSCDNGPYLWHTTSFNECIWIGGYSAGDWQIRVGLDLNVPTGYAQEAILACPANFSAELWGADTDRTPGIQSSPPSSEDDFLAYLPIAAGWPVLGTDLLSIEFEKVVGWQVLNEDDGTDEVYVVIKLNDCSSDFNPIKLRTNNIVHNF
jgi:hypothetical protein